LRRGAERATMTLPRQHPLAHEDPKPTEIPNP
jgi:hypothetical protein